MSDEHEDDRGDAPDVESDVEVGDVGISAAEAGVDVSDVDIDPEDVDIDDISDLSTEELIALSGGGVVDAEGHATAFGEGRVASPGTEPEVTEQSAEETAEQLSNHLDEISEDNTPQQEMFTDEWMAANTDFENLESFLDAGPWADGADIWDIETAKLDEHTAAHSEFDSWQAMSEAAGDEWMDDKLSFLQAADGDE